MCPSTKGPLVTPARTNVTCCALLTLASLGGAGSRNYFQNPREVVRGWVVSAPKFAARETSWGFEDAERSSGDAPDMPVLLVW